MIDSKNEKTILFIIKYTPPIFIISLALIISILLYLNNQQVIKEEQIKIKNEYILKNKEIIKSQVERVYKFINLQQSKTKVKLKENLKERVYEAHDIAINIYNENKHLGEETVTKMIKDALRNIKFNNGRGYFFIYSFDYKCILLPVAKHLEGKNFYNFKDGKGEYLTRNIIKQVKKDKEGFLTWWYHKPNDMKKQYKKLGFNKEFEPYGWFIGTGEYIDDFEEDVKKAVVEHINNLKYKNNGYVFILDYESNYLSHIRKDIIGLNALKNSDNVDFQVVKSFIELAKTKGSGFSTYTQKIRPSTNQPATKTSYVKSVNTWKWVVGKGFYENDVEEEIKNEVELIKKRLNDELNKLFIITLILTLILLFLSIYISKQIEKMFAEYKEEINKQQHILSQQSKMAAIGTMIGNIAHQWRQPLNLISTAATSIGLKRDLGDLKEEDLNESLEFINKSTQYLSKTIDDFRNFFLSNKEKEDFYLEHAINKALDIVSVQYKNKNIEIIKDISKVKIYAIESELVQVLINILNNAKDELLKLEDEKKYIFIKVKTKDEFVEITIRDNAGGVPKKIIEHVFEPYFTTKHQSQGTGIGLYMSKEIVEKHLDGSITIENTIYKHEKQEYKGAKITLVFDLIK